MKYGLDCFFERLAGVKTVADLRPENAERYIRERREEVSDRTVGIELGCVHRLFNWAESLELIASNPIKRVKAPPRPRPVVRRALDKNEVEALLAASPQRYRDIWQTFLLTGVRRGELCALTWNDVDFEARTITIRSEIAKTGEGRILPMHKAVYEILSRLKAECEAQRAEAMEEINRRGGKAFLEAIQALRGRASREARRLRARAEREHAFVTLDGTPWQRMTKKGNMPTNLHTRLDLCVTKAGIDPTGVTPHALRRTFVSELIRRGVNIKTVQRLAGHKDPKITLAIYAQMTSADLRTGVEALDFGTARRAEMATVGQQGQVA